MKLIYLLPLLVSTLPATSQDVSFTSLNVNERHWSPLHHYFVMFQGDGNLVVYTTDEHPVWSTKTNGSGATACQMQGDGNLVLYSGNTPIWSSGTSGHAGQTSVLQMQDDGNLVINACIKCYWTPLWSSLTGKWSQQQVDGFPKSHPNGAKCCVPPIIRPTQCMGNGVVSFQNITSNSYLFYFFYVEDVANGADECQVRQFWQRIYGGHTYKFNIPKGKTLAFRIYTSQNCDRNDLKQYGTLSACGVFNGTVTVD